MTTNDPLTCPDCGTLLPDDSPQQLCPSCLLKQAFASRTIDQAPAELSPPPSPEEIADKFPQFEITECLGRGGMGVVYKARQKSLNRWVAIKVLAPERIHDEKFAERFSREAQTLAQLNHPNIVTVHDYGETDGLYYIVMEFVDGVNLRDLLRDGKIESTQALTIVPPICEALQYAHDKGIVHRDIKPENLLIDRDGRVKIADFGIASLVGATDEQSGTPPYMAPEQGAHSNVDHRADIYALGAVLYEMLTGDRPNSPLDLPSQKVQLDIRIDDIVLRALSKEPERRYRTANEFRTVVENITPQANPTALDQPASSPAERPPAKRGMIGRWWWLFLVMLPAGPVMGLLCGLIYESFSPKEYQASATFQFTPKSILGPDSEASSPDPDFPKNHLEQISSGDFLQKVLRQLGLAQRWQLREEEALKRLTQSVEATNIRGTDLVELRVRASDPEAASDIANTIVRSYQELLGYTKSGTTDPEGDAMGVRTPRQRIAIHSLATLPRVPLSKLKSRLAIGGAIGLLASPLLALGLMSILHRRIPDKKPVSEIAELTEEQKVKRAFYGKVALWLFLGGTLGTLAMMTLSSNHLMALIFGGVALFLSIVFGLVSRRSGILITLIVVAILGVAVAVLSALIFWSQSRANLTAIQEGQRARSTAQIAESSARDQLAKSKVQEQLIRGLSFGPTIIREINAPTSSRQNCFLDLDTGKLIDVPSEIYPLVKHRFNAAVSKPVDADRKIGAWARESGADLMISMTAPSTHLALYGSSTSISSSPFDEASPVDVIQSITKKPSAESRDKIPPPFISFSAPNSHDSKAIVFRTREGATGVLTVLEISNSPTRVKVAFKLVFDSKGPVQLPSREFEHIATDYLIAVRELDIESAHALLLDTAYEQLRPQNELTEKKRSQMLTDFKEMNQAYSADPSLMLSVTEWHGKGGYRIGRLSPPKGGDGKSLYLVLALSPKGWRINDVNDIRSDELLPEKLDAWLKEN